MRPKPGELSDAEWAKLLAERLHIYSALVEALSQPEFLLEVIKPADSRDDARLRLQQAFALDELQATAVLDAQFLRATSREVDLLRHDRDEIEAELKALRG